LSDPFYALRTHCSNIIVRCSDIIYLFTSYQDSSSTFLLPDMDHQKSTSPIKGLQLPRGAISKALTPQKTGRPPYQYRTPPSTTDQNNRSHPDCLQCHAAQLTSPAHTPNATTVINPSQVPHVSNQSPTWRDQVPAARSDTMDTIKDIRSSIEHTREAAGNLWNSDEFAAQYKSLISNALGAVESDIPAGQNLIDGSLMTSSYSAQSKNITWRSRPLNVSPGTKADHSRLLFKEIPMVDLPRTFDALVSSCHGYESL